MSEETTTETTDTTETRKPVLTAKRLSSVCAGLACIFIGVSVLTNPDAGNRS